MLPTPLVAQQMARGGGIAVIITTEPVPHIALSASPRIPVATRQKIRESLLNANRSLEGRAMLKAIGFERFESATEDTYTNHARVLREYWGY
jgi:ABC-type phosphate/phosphonate transport system substrate-binding protein